MQTKLGRHGQGWACSFPHFLRSFLKILMSRPFHSESLSFYSKTKRARGVHSVFHQMSTSWEPSGAESSPDACCLLRWVHGGSSSSSVQHGMGCHENAGESGRTRGPVTPTGHTCVCAGVQTAVYPEANSCYFQPPPLGDQGHAGTCDYPMPVDWWEGTSHMLCRPSFGEGNVAEQWKVNFMWPEKRSLFYTFKIISPLIIRVFFSIFKSFTNYSELNSVTILPPLFTVRNSYLPDL